MAEGKQITGIRDTTYDLVAVLDNALQGGWAAAKYARDAEDAGKSEIAQFFRDVQDEERRRADRAKALLQKQWGQGDGKS